MKQYPGGQSVRFAECAIQKRDANAEGPAVYEVAVSSEFPVERSGFMTTWREVLDHSPTSVQMTRFTSGTAAVLEEHKGAPIGVVQRAWLDPKDKVMRAEVRFSRSARGQEVEQDVVDGIRSNISVGYIPKRAQLVEENAELGDLWRVTSWEPVELSFVGIPADPTVGLGRAIGEAGVPPVVLEVSSADEEEAMKKVRNDAGHVIEVNDDDPRQPIAERGLSDNDRDEMLRLAERYGASAGKVAEWIRSGKSVRDVMDELLESRITRGASQPNAESLTDLGLSAKDAQRYSYSRAILGAALLSEGKRFNGLEMEVHDELLAKHPEGASRRGGLLVPMQKGAVSHRTLDASTATKGTEVVFEQKGELIELLRNRTAVMMLGARSLTGLTAPVTFPKQSGPMTGYWVGENSGSNVTSSDVALALATLTPKTLQATTAYSRQLLAQSSVDIESMVTNELSIVHALAIDLAAIHGKGVAGEPTGIYKAIGVNAFDATSGGTTMTYAKLLSMVGLVATANADSGSLGWLMNPTMATNLKGLAMFTNTATPIWNGDYMNGNVAGYRAAASNQVSKSMTASDVVSGGTTMGCVFGDWSQLLIGFWGALELVVDPYSQKKQGLIEVTSFQLADVLVRHGESFAKSTGATG